ncbi:MAG TPA: hypothetical protein VGN34_16455 [Ktedonobacteraceae bacterium]
MLLSLKRIRQILGILWLIDGLLQLQPQMFTMNMVNKVLDPITAGQPALIASNLQWIVTVITSNLVATNIVIAVVQIALGVLFLSGRWVRETVIVSLVWSVLVWYGGEGMSLLLTGQGSALTGAPGAVLLYPLIGLLIYPRKDDPEQGLISRSAFRWFLAGFWLLSALLQLQPYWWQSGQISGAISGMVGMGGGNNVVVDPILTALANATATLEIPLNSLLIIIFLALALALVLVKEKQLRPVLIVSLVVSILLWYGTQALGGIFTGMATDFNSGLLLIVMTLAVWSKASQVNVASDTSAQTALQRENASQIG